jgi:hypothetical protein
MSKSPTVFMPRHYLQDTLPVPSRRSPLMILLLSLLACFMPCADGRAADGLPTIDNTQSATGDEALQKCWKELPPIEAANVARKHIHGLVRAAHLYHETHGEFPPAVVPNTKLPAGKRLSGLVLLLPYLHAQSWIEKGDPCFSAEVVELAKTAHKSINLTKAWDDPVNLEAARTVVPAFVAPQNGGLRTRQGFAVCHFAMVQGGSDGPDGVFPGEVAIKIADVTDGTVSTLAFGQVSHDTGPWIAEGLATARQVYPPIGTQPGTFGSLYHKSGCYFAMCDSTPFFLVFSPKTLPLLQQLSTRTGGEVVNNFQVTRLKNPFER